MEKYHLDLRMKMVFWFMGRAPQPCESNYLQIRNAPSSAPKILFRNFDVASVENRSIPGVECDIPVRIYRPGQASMLPVIVYYHGGGFVIGNLDGYDAICRRLAAENKAVVVSVDYRLAPEHKFPAAVDDAYDAAAWVALNAAELGADRDKLIVMGDSAGGNLAAAVSQMARDRINPHIACQVLIYPVVDLLGAYPSIKQYADNPVLSADAIEFFNTQYIDDPKDYRNPYASPLLAEDLSRLPPAFIMTAEYDPLLDEGKLYADCLSQAGVEVNYFCCSGMPHGFLSMGRLASGTEKAFSEIQKAIKYFVYAS